MLCLDSPADEAAEGAIGAAILDENQDTGKANWDVTSVSKSQFKSSCK